MPSQNSLFASRISNYRPNRLSRSKEAARKASLLRYLDGSLGCFDIKQFVYICAGHTLHDVIAIAKKPQRYQRMQTWEDLEQIFASSWREVHIAISQDSQRRGILFLTEILASHVHQHLRPDELVDIEPVIYQARRLVQNESSGFQEATEETSYENEVCGPQAASRSPPPEPTLKRGSSTADYSNRDEGMHWLIRGMGGVQLGPLE